MPSPPLCPHAQLSLGWGSPNPHSRSRGTLAPVLRSRIARRRLHTQQHVQLRAQGSRVPRGGERGQLGSHSLSSPDLASGSRFPRTLGGDGRTRSHWAPGPAPHASGRKRSRGVGLGGLGLCGARPALDLRSRRPLRCQWPGLLTRSLILSS